MTDEQFNLLLAKLLDEDMDSVEAGQLLDALQREPDRLEELAEHIYLWDLFDRQCRPERSQTAFIESCLTRLIAEQQGDQFVEKTKRRILECEASAPGRSQPARNIPVDNSDGDMIGVKAKENHSNLTPKQIKELADKKLEEFLKTQQILPYGKNRVPRNGYFIDRVEEFRDRLTAMKRPFIRTLKVATAFSLVCFIGLILWMIFTSEPLPVAFVSDTARAQWSTAPQSDQLRPGPMTLKKGFAELTFKDGTKVILEAPANVILEKANQMSLHKGKLVASMDKGAHGFIVRTPGAKIVDLGTEFGVWVNEQGQSETHVFDGQVNLFSNHKHHSRRLGIGQACTVDKAGQFSKDVSSIRKDIFQSYLPSPYELAVTRTRPAIYYRVNRDSPQQWYDVLSRKVVPADSLGALQLAQGPHLGADKDAYAMQFGGDDSAAVFRNLTVPKGLSRTIGYTHMLWVRADSIRDQVILVTFGAGLGQRILTMTADGRFHHSFLSTKGESIAPVSSQTMAQPGTWYHLAVMRNAYDDRRLFVNGVEEGVTELTAGTPEFHDTLQLGASPEGINTADIHSLRGAVSEIILYNRALKSQEIRKLYESTQEK